MNVKNAFLHDSLIENVYMNPPPSLIIPSGHVCHLHRAIYGVKQAPRTWFECFQQALTSFGFQQSIHDNPHDGLQESFHDHSLFVQTSPQGCVLLLLYIDDMIVIDDDTACIADTQRYIHRQFQMKVLCRLRYFLGFEIAQAEQGILIFLQKYTYDIIDVVALTDTKTIGTPLEFHSKLLCKSYNV